MGTGKAQEAVKQAVEQGSRGVFRREFLKEIGTGLVAIAGVGVLAKAVAAAPAATSSVMDRMKEDLGRALKKQPAQRHWAMAIDLKKCVGCKACTVACRAENKTPPGVTYRPVFEETEGSYPAIKRTHRPRPCMHCEKPACLQACPADAIKRRPDGIVYVDYDV